MKAILICPGERSAMGMLLRRKPLALTEIFGKPLLAHWLEHLFRAGARRVLILADDRPEMIRAFVGGGERWGVEAEVLAQQLEVSPAEARRRFRDDAGGPWMAEPGDASLADHFPGRPDLRLFDDFASFFAALEELFPAAMSQPRIGAREIQPGVWAGLHARIAPDATLRAPCWIGENAVIGSGCVAGPAAFLENGVVLEPGVRVSGSHLSPATFAAEGTQLRESIVAGRELANWRTGIEMTVPDDFLLCSLAGPASSLLPKGSWFGRLMAAAVLVATSPLVFAAWLSALVKGEQLFLAYRAVAASRQAPEKRQGIIHYRLASGPEWLRRWPRLWNIARGEFAWVGNPPLNSSQAGGLCTDFERLWFQSRPGLVSILDVENCENLLSDDARAHAAYYTVQKALSLDAAIVWRLVWRRRLRLARHLPGRGVSILQKTRDGVPRERARVS